MAAPKSILKKEGSKHSIASVASTKSASKAPQPAKFTPRFEGSSRPSSTTKKAVTQLLAKPAPKAEKVSVGVQSSDASTIVEVSTEPQRKEFTAKGAREDYYKTPEWAYVADYEGTSTNREDFKGHWQAENRRAINQSTKLTVQHLPFDSNSTNRADFVAFQNVEPRKSVDPRSLDQLKFEWKDASELNSTHRADFIKFKDAKPRDTVDPASLNQLKFQWDDKTQRNSTHRADFIQFDDYKPREVVDGRSLDQLKFDYTDTDKSNSTHRADFIKFEGAQPREVVDPASRNQLKFEWNDPTPPQSTMRGDFINMFATRDAAC